MKIGMLFINVALSLGVLACNDSDKKTQNPEPESLTTPSEGPFGKTNFTFASPGRICENIENFMIAYKKSFMKDVNLVIDSSCSVSKDLVSKDFAVVDHDDARADLRLEVDFSKQNSDPEARVQGGARLINNTNVKLDMAALNSRFAGWVEENSPTTKEACEVLKQAHAACVMKGQQ